MAGDTVTSGGWLATGDGPARQHAVLLGAVVIFGLAVRLSLAVSTPLIYDEYQWIELADSVDLRPGQAHLPLHGDQHPPGQVYWAAIGRWLFGPNLLGYRAASVVLGTAAVLCMYVVGRRLAGPGAGLLAAFLLATNEYHIGISRLCTEKNYLTFALLGVWLFDRALAHPSARSFLAAGAVLGLGSLTKQALALWVPLFAFEILRRPDTRRLWRHPGPWCGLAVLLLIVSPDLAWNLAGTPAVGTDSDRGIGYQLSRLTPGTWSWGPLALYVRPLYFHGVEPAISEYASMTTLPGGILLLGAAASLLVLRSHLARLLQLIGVIPFALFCLLAARIGSNEFWWADLSLLSFIALTSGVVERVGKARPAVSVGVAVVMLAAAGRMIGVRDNYYPLDWGTPPAPVVDRFQSAQRRLIVEHRGVDHLQVCTVAGFRTPACDFYAGSLRWYESLLEGRESGDPAAAPGRDGLPIVGPEALAGERDWVGTELERFRRSR